MTRPAHGKPRACDVCGGSGVVRGHPDAPSTGAAAADVEKVSRLASRAGGGDVDALGKLLSQVGPLAAARLLAG